MFCPKCDADIPARSETCPECGARLATDEPRIGATIRAPENGGQDDREDNPPRREGGAERFKERLMESSKDRDDDREELLWEGGYSPKAMFGHWLAAAVATVGLGVALAFLFALPPAPLVIGILAALVWLWPLLLLAYRRLAIHYRLTSQRFVHEFGILSRVSDRIEVIDIDDVSCRQSLIDRMLGVGTIRIDSGDRTHPELLLPGIDDVRRICDVIDNARRKERVRRGIHIASAGDRGGL